MAFLSWLLMWFEAISGLRINLDKSEILPVGRVENVEILALGTRLKVGANLKGLSAGWEALERKPYLIKWAIVCSDKKKGGLGVRSLSTLNWALLFKWSWRFAVERETLWKLCY